ncbi:MAG: LON peptidase substrate-binding domain-containing protein, partial [Bdellovibrionota bacterium]
MQDSKNFPHSGVPVLSLRHVVLFPAQSMPVWVSAEKSAQAIQAAQDQGGWVFVVKTKSSERIDKPENLYHVGTLAKIEQVKSYSNETLQVSLSSAVRFEVEQFDLREGFLVASGGQKIDKFDASEATMSALEKSLRESAYEIFGLLPPEMARFQDLIDSIKDPLVLSYTLSQHLGFDFETKQKILEEDSVKNRLLKILDALVKLKDELSVQKEIGSKISSELSRKQRDAILREQLKAIQEQLGEG